METTTTVRNEKAVLKAVSNLIATDNKISGLFLKVRDYAKELLELNGYSETKDYKHNASVLKVSKSDIYKGLIVQEMFAIGDSSVTDKQYKKICSALEQVSVTGRNKGKAETAGNTSKGNKTAKTETAKPETVIKERAFQPKEVKLSEEQQDNLNLEYSVKGNIAHIWDTLELELLDYIASTPEIQRDILFRINGK